MAAATTGARRRLGFEAGAGNASESGNDVTRIYYNDDSLAAALGVAEALVVAQSSVSQNTGAYTTTYDVIVVLGTDQG